MEASCVGEPVVGKTTLSLQDFLHAFEPSNRVFPVAHLLLRANRRPTCVRSPYPQIAICAHAPLGHTSEHPHWLSSPNAGYPNPFRLSCFGLVFEAGRT